MPESRLSYLFERYMNGSSTEREDIELSTYILAPGHAAELEQLKEAFWKKTDGETLNEEEAENLLSKILLPIPQSAKVFSFRRIAVAASLLIAIVTGSYFLFFDKSSKPDEIVKMEPAKDVKAPETNRAMITLADGRTVYLDSAMNGQLALQGNIKLVKLSNGQIAYQTASGEVLTEIKYNTLNNPRGSKVISMALADGSVVWLNAGSSVTFPVAFVGNDRRVSITGEAYFEVVHDASKPFVVSKGETSVTVLGTHFNVNAYDDEQDIKITLLEGSVKVSNGTGNGLLKPGQQARVVNRELSIVNDADIEQVMAWKNGAFSFKSTDIRSIMRQIATWYDVEVIYEKDVSNETITGDISREVNVSQVMKMLEFAGIHFSIEGKKVTVMK